MKTRKIRTYLLLILVLRWLPMAAASDFATVDRLTYRYFLERKWDSVIITGKQALHDDIDYYYLRVRLGIAYFERTDYFPAAVHLEKARGFNNGDDYVADYLYQAYIYTNRPDEASRLRRTWHRSHPDKPAPGEKDVPEVHAEAGYTFSSNSEPSNLADLSGNDKIYGEQDLYGNNSYAGLSLHTRLFGGLGLSFAYNYLNFNKTRYIQYGHAEAKLDSVIENPFSIDYFYAQPFPWVVHDTAIPYRVYQHEAHLGLSFRIPGGIKVTPAVHLVYDKYPVIRQTRTDSVSDTAYFLKSDSSWHMFKYPSVNYHYSLIDTGYVNWVVALGLTRDFGIFSLNLNGSWSNLNGMSQKQAGMALSYYPLGNLDLYGTTAATLFLQKGEKRLLFSQTIGTKITSRFWAEANFTWGDLTNANLYNGSVVYNNSDIIDYRAGANLVYLAGRHLRVSLIYQYVRKESTQLYYIKNETAGSPVVTETPQTQNNPYQTNSIILGIIWKL